MCGVRAVAHQETGERSVLVLGKVTSLERNHVAVQSATAGSGSVAVKIEGTDEQSRLEVGKHFDVAQGVYSRVRAACGPLFTYRRHVP